MKLRTAKSMSLKGKVKNLAKEKDVSAQLVLQNFIMERFLNRLSVSEYKDKFIVKGGSLVSCLVGLENRTTMDIDVTVKGFDLEKDNTERIIKDILKIQLDDETSFEFKKSEPIRDDDIYGGLRVFMNGIFDSSAIIVPFTIDVSTGDVITPAPKLRKWGCLFDSETSFELWTYSTETILAEKIQTILSRGVLSTRPRDFYDVYVITKLLPFDKEIFKKALEETSRHRKSYEEILSALENFNIIEDSSALKSLWHSYAENNSYATDLSYNDVIAAVKNLIF